MTLLLLTDFYQVLTTVKVEDIYFEMLYFYTERKNVHKSRNTKIRRLTLSFTFLYFFINIILCFSYFQATH